MMPRHNELMPRSDFAIIERFLLDKLSHCQQAIDKLESIPRSSRPDFAVNALAYWRHARGAMAWALGNARQRAGVKHVGNLEA